MSFAFFHESRFLDEMQWNVSFLLCVHRKIGSECCKRKDLGKVNKKIVKKSQRFVIEKKQNGNSNVAGEGMKNEHSTGVFA